jgi:5S rRNA maturation endonuclease (ribonuclease M5)
MIAEADLLARFEKVERQREGDWLVRCPAHADGRPSLHVTHSTERWLLHCLAGCTFDEVREAAGLAPEDIGAGRNSREPVAIYTYTDEESKPLFEVGRFEPKSFLQRRPGRADWKGGIRGVRRVIYRLPKVIEAIKEGTTIYVVEGEKDVHALEHVGRVATTNPQGAGQWKDEYSVLLVGAKVIVVADRDEEGYKRVEKIAKSLDGVAAKVWTVQPAEGKDISDHLAAGLAPEALVPITFSKNGAEPDESAAPPPADVDGAGLLEAIREFITRHVILAAEVADALALFVVHTWTLNAATYTPYLYVRSPTKRAGKTRLLEVLKLLCRNAVKAGSITAAAVFQLVEARRPTLLIDEADRIFKAKGSEHAEALVGVLNDGFHIGGSVFRGTQSGEPKEFSTWCPKVLAGIENNSLPDTITDRCIVVSLQTKLKSERVDRLRGVDGTAKALRDACTAWAYHHTTALASYRIPTIETISDRAEDIWEPLFAIADEVGGDWPERVRKAVHALAGEEAGEESQAITLLTDIRAAFGNTATISTEDLLKALNENEESPWGARRDGKGLDARGLAKLLKPFTTPDGARIRPQSVRVPGVEGTSKGYKIEQFADVFARHLSVSSGSHPASVSGTSGTSGTSKSQSQADVPDVPDVPDMATAEQEALFEKYSQPQEGM